LEKAGLPDQSIGQRLRRGVGCFGVHWATNPVKLEKIFQRRVRTILPFAGYLTFTELRAQPLVPGRGWCHSHRIRSYRRQFHTRTIGVFSHALKRNGFFAEVGSAEMAFITWFLLSMPTTYPDRPGYIRDYIEAYDFDFDFDIIDDTDSPTVTVSAAAYGDLKPHFPLTRACTYWGSFQTFESHMPTLTAPARTREPVIRGRRGGDSSPY
jgi:hypothetical protein